LTVRSSLARRSCKDEILRPSAGVGVSMTMPTLYLLVRRRARVIVVDASRAGGKPCLPTTRGARVSTAASARGTARRLHTPIQASSGRPSTGRPPLLRSASPRRTGLASAHGRPPPLDVRLCGSTVQALRPIAPPYARIERQAADRWAADAGRLARYEFASAHGSPPLGSLGARGLRVRSAPLAPPLDKPAASASRRPSGDDVAGRQPVTWSETWLSVGVVARLPPDRRAPRVQRHGDGAGGADIGRFGGRNPDCASSASN